MKLFIPSGLSWTEVGKLLPRFKRLNLIYEENLDIEYYKDISELNGKEVGGVIFKDHSEQLQMMRNSGVPCMFYTSNVDECDKLLKSLPKHQLQGYNRTHEYGFEVTTKGDRRFSPFCIKLENGYTIENYYQLVIKGGNLMGFDNWRQMKGRSPWVIEFFNGNWTREQVLNDPTGLYIFTDNLCRRSGNNRIDTNSSYFKKYGEKGVVLYYPNCTQACIRGLNNAYPISTMQDGYGTQLSEDDIYKIALTWEKEIDDIINAYKSNTYNRIVIANCPIGNGRYSRICDNEILFDFLCKYLRRLGISNNKFSIGSIYSGVNYYEALKQVYVSWLVNNPEMLIELYCLTYDKVLTDMFMNSELSQAKIYSEILNELMK